MNATQNTAQAAPESVAGNRTSKRALGAFAEYVSRVLAASALTMWGALNLVVSARNGIPFLPKEIPIEEVAVDLRAAADSAYITIALIAVTAVLPFLIGLNMFRRLYSQTKVR